jgi:hypothetical protein
VYLHIEGLRDVPVARNKLIRDGAHNFRSISAIRILTIDEEASTEQLPLVHTLKDRGCDGGLAGTSQAVQPEDTRAVRCFGPGFDVVKHRDTGVRRA